MFKYMNMSNPRSTIRYRPPGSFFKSNTGFMPTNKKAASISRTIPAYAAYHNTATKPVNKTYAVNTRKKPRTMMSSFFSGISTAKPQLTGFKGGKRSTKRSYGKRSTKRGFSKRKRNT